MKLRLAPRSFFRALLILAMTACATTTMADCRAPLVSDQAINSIALEFKRKVIRIASSATILRYTFTAADAPPRVDAIYVGGDERFAERMKEEAGKLRSSCASPDRPVVSAQLARLVTWDSQYGRFDRRLNRELQLADIMKITKDSKHIATQIDTRTMGCPFTLTFAPLQPYLPNRVEDPMGNPRRAPLVSWLRSVTLGLPTDMMVTAIGQESTVSVPCAVLDLS